MYAFEGAVMRCGEIVDKFGVGGDILVTGGLLQEEPLCRNFVFWVGCW